MNGGLPWVRRNGTSTQLLNHTQGLTLQSHVYVEPDACGCMRVLVTTVS